MARRADGETKRTHILETALRCFRDKGFDETTMRDIAREAEVSLGNAYHYFPSKNAIVAAYYDVQQDRHEKLALGRMEGITDLRERLGIAFHTKIDAVRKDRRLLIAVSRSLADPSDPLSAFSEESRAVRDRAIGVFEAALDVPVVLPERRRLLATALWGLHLTSLAYLVRDESRGQRKTRTLVDGALDLMVPLLLVSQMPGLESTWQQLGRLLAEAGLDVDRPVGAPE